MTARILHNQQNTEEKQIKRQMGCITGFLHIFDRNHFLQGKSGCATKLLTPSPATESPPQSEKSEESLTVASDEQHEKEKLQNSPETPAKAVLPSQTEELKSPWKFRESPRLSLDSRATMDGKGNLYPREIRTNSIEEDNDKQKCSSPSVVARLMGLEALPESTTREPLKKPDLRRSASESKFRDLNRLVEDNNVHQKQQRNVEGPNPTKKWKLDQGLATSPWKSQQQGKSYFDSQDFYPEPKQTSYLYGELEKRLKMRGISKPAEDLETLKQILEALQLKGLLHSRRRVEKTSSRNFVYVEETPIAIIKPSKPPASRRNINQSSPSKLRSQGGIIRRNINASNETLPPVKGRIDHPVHENGRRLSCPMSPDRSESNARSPCSPARRIQLNGRNESVEQRRSSPLNSPGRSPRTNKRSTAKILSKEIPIEDESPQFHVKSQRFKTEDCKEGKKLSMADNIIIESQPSPVSVLDSSFYKDDDMSPLKRCTDFRDQSREVEEDNWRTAIVPIRLRSNDADFVYILEIIEASNCGSKLDLFLLLEKQSYRWNSCNVSRLHRKLVFDTITDILHKKKQLSPWKAILTTDFTTGRPSFRQIWLEYSRIRERPKAENLVEVICGALKKDLAEETINEWGDFPAEMSEMALDIERLIFKDLVEDAIRNFPTFSGKNRGFVRKKLVF